VAHGKKPPSAATTEVDVATAVQSAPAPLPRWDDVVRTGGDESVIRVSDLGVAPPDSEGPHITRRELLLYRLLAGGLGAAVLAKLGMNVWTEFIWPSDRTDSRWLPEGEALVRGKRPIERVFKVFQGTGRKHGRPYCEWIAHNAYNTLASDNTTLPLYSDLANGGATPADWARQIVDVRRFAPEMDAVAISAGGASLFAGLLSAIRMGIQPVTLGHCVFVNSAFDERAFDDKVVGKLASRYSEFSDGTVVDKAGMWVVDSWAKDRRTVLREWRENPLGWLAKLHYEATHGSPPVMMGNQIRTVKFGVHLDRDWQELAPAISPRTRFLYLYTPGDRYVNNDVSLQTLARFARRHNIPLSVLPTPPGIGHADVEAASKVIGPWLGVRQATRGD
jgi:hypothetical protein